MKKHLLVYLSIFFIALYGCKNTKSTQEKVKNVDTVIVRDTVIKYKDKNLSYDELRYKIHEYEASKCEDFLRVYYSSFKLLGKYYIDIKVINYSLTTVYTNIPIEMTIYSYQKNRPLKKEVIYVNDISYPSDTVVVSFPMKLPSGEKLGDIDLKIKTTCYTGMYYLNAGITWDNSDNIDKF